MRPTVESSDSKVVKLCLIGDDNVFGSEIKTSKGQQVEFLKTGSSEISVKLAGEVFLETIKVEQLPFSTGVPAADVIGVFGFPTSKKRFYVSWPNLEVIDNIIYNPSAGQSGIGGEHWRFEKHPGLVVSIINDKVGKIGSCSKP